MTDASSDAKNLNDALAALAPAEDHHLLAAFLDGVNAHLRFPREAALLSWRQPEEMWALFQFFRQPLSGLNESIKTRLAPLRPRSGPGDAKSAGEEGTIIMVHLPDTPFILETWRNYLKQSRLTIFGQAHANFSVLRDSPDETLTGLASPEAEAGNQEILLLAISEPVTDPEALATIATDLEAVLVSVRRSVSDFPRMRERLSQAADALQEQGRQSESHFVRWALEENFIFMGVRFPAGDDGARENPGEEPLGQFRGTDANDLLDHIMPGMRQEVDAVVGRLWREEPEQVLSIEYVQHGHSILYASEGVDFFLVRPPRASQEEGETVASEPAMLVLGRFSRSAMASRGALIPLLDGRLRNSLAQAGLQPGSYLHHEFRRLFDRSPLRELFHADSAETAMRLRDILALQGDTDVRCHPRIAGHGRYLAILTTLSRNRYQAGLEKRIAGLLSGFLPQPITTLSLSETGTHFFVLCYARCDPDDPPALNRSGMEKGVRQLVMTWSDRLREATFDVCPPQQAVGLFSLYAEAFPSLYRESTQPAEAAEDLMVLEKMAACPTSRFASRVLTGAHGETIIKLFVKDPLELTQVVQTFSHFGIVCLQELSTPLRIEGREPVIIQRFEVSGEPTDLAQLAKRAELFSEALEMIRAGRAHDDELNRLVLLEGMTVREVFLVRALRQYLLQINPALAAASVNRVMTTHPGLAKAILDAFLIRFDPDLENREEKYASVRARFEEGLSQVANLQEDQILRRLFNVVEASLRTNYFQKEMPAPLAIKLDCNTISQMPNPRPWRTIFTLGAHMEGIHLRGGRVSRGGLRFSDRLEDYRTEVLGLMKTQMVKNALIVPMGAKGGFVIPGLARIPEPERKDWVTEQYSAFIRGMLDITDNRIEGRIVPPNRVVAHDEPDPYLVVAADKGTATFSDLANHIAQNEYHFWLGDAFASGGSNGYDHKKVGITARGAWECIRLHFLELGRDIDRDPFTVVGIGDMSGDVFGNGLLASPNIRLVGAFNHRHIFLDPDPDPETAFAERQRLFALPRSTWRDYNPEWISSGGGVFERSAKAIPLNGAMKRLLGTEADLLSGEAVIARLLRAEVDLLFNGGIGTYVKSVDQTHLEVSDKSNDAVRVNADQVRALIIGEGGNLGVTQKGRLAFSLRGENPGRINTDAVDNSGGVDLSDREVNLKILFEHLIEIGEIKSLEERNTLLERLTEEVADRVLEDNRMQHMAISRDQLFATRRPFIILDALEVLAAEAGLDAEAEEIPSREVISGWLEQAAPPRPLLAVMLGYTKLLLYKRLLASDVVDQFYFERFISDYFPEAVSREFGAHLSDHYLKREIIATNLTNRVVNQTGLGPLLSLYGKLPRLPGGPDPLPYLIKAYLIAEILIDGPEFRRQVHALGPDVAVEVKYQALAELESVLLHQAAWMVTHLDPDRIAVDLINLYGKIILAFQAQLWENLPTLVSPARFEELERGQDALIASGLTETLATETVLLPFLKDTMTILHIKETLHTPFEPVGQLYIQLDDFFGLTWIEQGLQKIRHRDVWGRMNLENVRRELSHTRNRLVRGVIAFKRHGETVSDAFANYLKEVEGQNVAYQELLKTLREQPSPDLLPLSVLVRQLEELLPEQGRAFGL